MTAESLWRTHDAIESYRPDSPDLSYKGTVLRYEQGSQTYEIDLADLYLPPTAPLPYTTRLSDHKEYVNIVLAVADRRIDRALAQTPPVRMLTRQIYLVRNVIDWLRARGIYHLSDAGFEDTSILVEQLARGGWASALCIEQRWEQALDSVTAGDFAHAFHFRQQREGPDLIECLRHPFWRPRVGWGGYLPLPKCAKLRIEAMAKNWGFTDGWHARRTVDGDPPSAFVLRNMLGWLNDLADLPDGIDRLSHRVSDSTTSHARKLALKTSTRTSNLQLEVAVNLLKTGLHFIYEVAPLLIQLYEEAHRDYSSQPYIRRKTWLGQSTTRLRLETTLGKPVTVWMWSGSHARNPTALAVDEILAAVQGACAIVLAAMNARRQREICDPRTGVRSGDFIEIDDALGIYQCSFYIEKTYRNRHLFYINRTSAEAFRCLSRLKDLCQPLNAPSASKTRSLFSCGRHTATGINGEAHLSFSEDKGRTRSLMSFLKLAFPGCLTPPDITSHMFRRFYALLYFYRYEHAELRCLKQQLRHLDVAMTKVYVTDPAHLSPSDQIESKLSLGPQRRQTTLLHTALDQETYLLEASLSDVGREKLRETVDQILEGKPTGGGFRRIVQKLYAKMLSRSIEWSDESSDATQNANHISKLLDDHGYRVRPMNHGQCHAPNVHRVLNGACYDDGVVRPEHASPSLCHRCPFHFNNEVYLENIKALLSVHDADRHNYLLPLLQQVRAESDYKNLTRVITLVEHDLASGNRGTRN